MIPNQGDRILFLTEEGRLRAGYVAEVLAEGGETLLFVSTEAGRFLVPEERLQCIVKLQAERSADQTRLRARSA